MGAYNEHSKGTSQEGKTSLYRKRGKVIHRCGVCREQLKSKEEVVNYLPKEYGHTTCLYK